MTMQSELLIPVDLGMMEVEAHACFLSAGPNDDDQMLALAIWDRNEQQLDSIKE